ncbi:cytochrome c biogenesis protein CcdA [Candidatus Parcubacteria bacterium]|nr:cytochrome c biogenesis protein CcdA [Candidatus Parcubacteria bacterium]
MIEVTIGLAVSAFIAGLFMFLAPCTLPLVPAYLGFISGVSAKDLEENREGSNKKIFWNGFFFILGFSVVFILFGVIAGFAGRQLVQYQDILVKIGGVMVIFFGLFILGVFNLPFLQAEKKLSLPKFIKPGNPASSFIVGAAFSIGWSPCVGPILGSILLLAGTQGTVLSGAILLAIFSLGMGLPFLLVALGVSKATKYIQKIEPVMKWVTIVGGVFLIFLGVLLLTNNLSLLLEWGYGIVGDGFYNKFLNFL